MEKGRYKHAIRNPSGIKIAIAMIALCSLFSRNGFWNDREDALLLSARIALLCFCAIVLIWSLYRTFKKPGELLLREDAISVNGRIIKAEQIKVIMSMGDFNQSVIGIKPCGKRIVPVALCFRFAKADEEGAADLADWAEKNKVKAVPAFFFRWI